MALTKNDLEKIKEAVSGETTPYFTAIKQDFNRVEKRLENFVTKDYLDEKLENFVTKDYLDEKLENFVTKDYLDEKLEEKLEPLRKEILDGQDKISKQLTDLQTETVMGTEAYKRHDNKLENHEERITKLEAEVA